MDKKGNMYDWVHKQRYNFIGGECPHQCEYCYVKSLHYPATKERYSGKIRLLESEFKKPLKADKPIFVGSCFDMFAADVPYELIVESLAHIRFVSRWSNKYIFQSKNPGRFVEFVHLLPNAILGTTIETNRVDYDCDFSVAPMVNERFAAMRSLKKLLGIEIFVTIEPIMDFDVIDFAKELHYCQPDFVNIGADSKRHNLPEPSWDKVQSLIAELSKFTTVKCKSNLDRLKK